MDKQQKDKKPMPKAQDQDKTNRTIQSTQNAANVRGEMAIRGHHSKQNNDKSNDRKEKNS